MLVPMPPLGLDTEQYFMGARYGCNRGVGIGGPRKDVTHFRFPHYENACDLSCRLCRCASVTLFTIQS